MKIGVDVHGVITHNPGGFKRFLSNQMAKHEVFIVSGPPEEDVKEELDALGIYEGHHYDQILSVIDYLRYAGHKTWEDPVGSGHWWADSKVWWATKSQIARDYQIDVLIDDHDRYSQGMPDFTIFVLYEEGKMYAHAFGIGPMTLKEDMFDTLR